MPRLEVGYAALCDVWDGTAWQDAVKTSSGDEICAFFATVPPWFVTHATEARRQCVLGVFQNANPADAVLALCSTGVPLFTPKVMCRMSSQEWCTQFILNRVCQSVVAHAKTCAQASPEAVAALAEKLAVLVLRDPQYELFLNRRAGGNPWHVSCCSYHRQRAATAGGHSLPALSPI